MIRERDRNHGFGHGDDPWDDYGVVAAVDSYFNGFAVAGDGFLEFGDAGGGFYGSAYDDVLSG